MANDEISPGQDAEPTDASHIQLIEDKVRDLVRMRDEGMLTYEEFTAKKAILLAQL